MMRKCVPRRLSAVAILLFLLVPAMAQGQLFGGALKPSAHVDVAMTDGTKLSTDYYLPEDIGGPYPTILIRSTYGRVPINPERFTKQGYAVVLQDLRGMGQSEGEAHVFYTDGWRSGLTDGADTVAWVKAQPWCNGKIATYGGSALAMTQMLLAPTTRDVAAQLVEMTPSDFYCDVVYPGGVFRKSLVENWLTGIGQAHVIDFYKARPYYSEFWSYYNTVEKAGDITAPAIFISGWYDIFQQGTINGFVARELHGGKGAKDKNYLVIKWSSHKRDVNKDYRHRQNRFDVPISQLRNAFFDYYLRGEKDGLAKFSKVYYYVMGADTPEDAPGNEWRTAVTWPPFATDATPYYLHEGGHLATTAPTQEQGARAFTFDPSDPYPCYGGANLALWAGPFDQRKYSTTRTDLLTFATAPLDTPLEITGRVTVKLWVSSDAPDTDFTAKLVDIYPEGDGREILMLDNIRRVKLRRGFDQPLPLLTGPTQIVDLEIDLWSISWVFNTGHRIGLHISSSNYPRYEANANTGADHPTDGGEMRIAHNTVHMTTIHPSAIILPVRPNTDTAP